MTSLAAFIKIKPWTREAVIRAFMFDLIAAQTFWDLMKLGEKQGDWK